MDPFIINISTRCIEGTDLFTYINVWQKDWTVIYDKMICLKDGLYRVFVQCTSVNSDDNGYLQIYINDTASLASRGSSDSSERTVLYSECDAVFKERRYCHI